METDKDLMDEYERFMLFSEVYARQWKEEPLDFDKLFEVVFHAWQSAHRIKCLESARCPIRREGMQFVSYCDEQGNLTNADGTPVVKQ